MARIPTSRMARPKPDESIETAAETPVPLVPFTVIVNGESRVVMAKDFDDAHKEADKLRSTTSPS